MPGPYLDEAPTFTPINSADVDATWNDPVKGFPAKSNAHEEVLAPLAGEVIDARGTDDNLPTRVGRIDTSVVELAEAIATAIAIVGADTLAGAVQQLVDDTPTALDHLDPPTSAISAGGQRVTDGADPVGDQDFATKSYVLTRIGAVIDGAPEAMNTLLEIADWIEDDETDTAALVLEVGGKASRAANLADLASASAARTNLGLGTAAQQDTGAFLPAGSPRLAPDPTGQPDNKWVRTSGGAYVLADAPAAGTTIHHTFGGASTADVADAVGVDGAFHLHAPTPGGEGATAGILTGPKGATTTGAWDRRLRFHMSRFPEQFTAISLAGGPELTHAISTPTVWHAPGTSIPADASTGYNDRPTGMTYASGHVPTDTGTKNLGIRKMTNGYGAQSQEAQIVSVAQIVTRPTEANGLCGPSQSGFAPIGALVNNTGVLKFYSVTDGATYGTPSASGAVVNGDWIIFERIGVLIRATVLSSAFAYKSQIVSLAPAGGWSGFFSTGCGWLWHATTTGKMAGLKGLV